MVRIGVVGDYNPANKTHVSTTTGLQHAAAALGVAVEVSWIPTPEIEAGPGLAGRLDFDGLFVSPGSPYRNLDGAVAAIEYARLRSVPLLGTCGGFQHLVLEYARNVAGLAVSGTDADGEPRILELPGHPFFMGTLFVPQASSTPGDPHPLLIAFVQAAIAETLLPEGKARHTGANPS